LPKPERAAISTKAVSRTERAGREERRKEAVDGDVICFAGNPRAGEGGKEKLKKEEKGREKKRVDRAGLCG